MYRKSDCICISGTNHSPARETQAESDSGYGHLSGHPVLRRMPSPRVSLWRTVLNAHDTTQSSHQLLDKRRWLCQRHHTTSVIPPVEHSSCCTLGYFLVKSFHPFSVVSREHLHITGNLSSKIDRKGPRSH